MTPKIREKVERATVRFPEKGGLGVVLRSNLIATAAHLIPWDGDDSAMGVLFESTVLVDVGGRTVRSDVRALDPAADIAFVGACDDEEDAESAEAFGEAMKAIAPLDISRIPLGPLDAESQRFHTFTHGSKWIGGLACELDPARPASIWFFAEEPIGHGTAGGPIVTDDGLLLAVHSGSTLGDASSPAIGMKHAGTASRPHLAAPVWIARQIV